VATGVRDLQGAWNFRDVADTTRVLRPGRLFRSGELSGLADEGRDELRRLGITDVADLRSRSEVLRHGPGLVPDGVDIHLLPIPDLPPNDVDPDDVAPHEHAFKRLFEEKPDGESISDAASRYMVEEYSRFPTYPGAREALHRMVTLLGDGRTMLAHCFAGKDRTGVLAALTLSLLGVADADIATEYALSELTQGRLSSQLRAEGVAMDVPMAFVVCPPQAMLLFLTELNQRYGSVRGYAETAGVTDGHVAALRAHLLNGCG